MRGSTAAAVIEWRANRPLPGIRALLRSVPVGRLILLDLVLTLGTAIGFLLLVIPGLVFMAYFSISPAMVKIEHRGVWASMRRARELVRGNFWRVMLIVVGTILGTEIAVSLISESFHGVAAVALIDLAADGLPAADRRTCDRGLRPGPARAARRGSGAGGARHGRRRRALRSGSLKTNGPPP